MQAGVSEHGDELERCINTTAKLSRSVSAAAFSAGLWHPALAEPVPAGLVSERFWHAYQLVDY